MLSIITGLFIIINILFVPQYKTKQNHKLQTTNYYSPKRDSICEGRRVAIVLSINLGL